jgi:hypothetical protein
VTERAVRRALGALLRVVAGNAFGGGHGLAGAEGVPVERRTGTPFADDAVPGLLALRAGHGFGNISSMSRRTASGVSG